MLSVIDYFFYYSFVKYSFNVSAILLWLSSGSKIERKMTMVKSSYHGHLISILLIQSSDVSAAAAQN